MPSMTFSQRNIAFLPLQSYFEQTQNTERKFREVAKNMNRNSKQDKTMKGTLILVSSDLDMFNELKFMISIVSDVWVYLTIADTQTPLPKTINYIIVYYRVFSK